MRVRITALGLVLFELRLLEPDEESVTEDNERDTTLTADAQPVDNGPDPVFGFSTEETTTNQHETGGRGDRW